MYALSGNVRHQLPALVSTSPSEWGYSLPREMLVTATSDVPTSFPVGSWQIGLTFRPWYKRPIVLLAIGGPALGLALGTLLGFKIATRRI